MKELAVIAAVITVLMIGYLISIGRKGVVEVQLERDIRLIEVGGCEYVFYKRFRTGATMIHHNQCKGCKP